MSALPLPSPARVYSSSLIFPTHSNRYAPVMYERSSTLAPGNGPVILPLNCSKITRRPEFSRIRMRVPPLVPKRFVWQLLCRLAQGWVCLYHHCSRVVQAYIIDTVCGCIACSSCFRRLREVNLAFWWFLKRPSLPTQLVSPLTRKTKTMCGT